jgi:tRNA threonylcarbamoyladenosine biosynthesis protein TsaE
MAAIETVSHSAEETIELGRRLARRLGPPVLVLMSGDLGSGKTTLSKGIISGLGAAREEDVTSPTFTLVHLFHNSSPGAGSTGSPLGTPGAGSTWSPQGTKVYHVDLYRIEKAVDLESLGLEDALSEPAVVLVEWPDRFSLRTDWPKVTVQLEHLEGDSRRITISGPSTGPLEGL